MTYNRFCTQKDTTFSDDHRQLAYGQAMQDIDHILYEPGTCKILAIFEEKNANIAFSTRTPTSNVIDLNTDQFKICRKFAAVDDAMVFTLINNSKQIGFPSYYFVAANKKAKEFLVNRINKDRTYLSQQEYYHFECWIRGKKEPLPPGTVLNTQKDRFQLPEIIDFTED